MTYKNVYSFGKLISLLVGSGMLLTACGGGGGGGSDGGSPGGGSGSARVSGTIEIIPGTRVDGDYADLWSPGAGWSVSRGSVSIPVPVVVGGYLSDGGGDYSAGLSYPQDIQDVYDVDLAERDRYFLQCFSSLEGTTASPSVTLSLGVVDITDACGKGGEVPSDLSGLSITANGGGPFRYVLTLAVPGALSAFDVSWPEPPLKVNEAIVTGSAAVANTLSASGLRASSVMSLERAIGPNTWQVRRAPGTQSFSVGSMRSGDPRAQTIDWIRSMREDFGMAVEPNYLFSLASLSPGDNLYYRNDNEDGLPNNWNLVDINMEAAWGLTNGSWGQDVGVAVMDTGMFSSTLGSYGNWHEDLAANVAPDTGDTLDFVSAEYDVDQNPGRDGNPATPPTPDNPERTSFHGTHVAGIIAAEDNTIGTLGIAHQATIFPYRVLGVDPVDGTDGTGGLADLIAAINAASQNAEIDAVNLSLGGLPQSDALQSATDRAYDAGQLVVAAGGNSGDGSAVYPAANRRVLGVGATDRDNTLSGFSNYGQSVDLLAPGGNLGDGIVNAYGNYSNGNLESSYAYLAGTSMAAPHVTGVFALMKDKEPTLSPDQFRARLIAGYLTDASRFDDYALFGAGLLDAQAALTDPPSQFPTVVSAWPRVLEINRTGSETEVLLEVLKEDLASAPLVNGTPTIPTPFEITDGSGNPIELSDGDNIPERLHIRVNTAELDDGRDVSGEIVIRYSTEGPVRDLTIPLYVQAVDQPEDRNAGRHYVLLLNADNPDSSRSRQVAATLSGGQYSFSLDGVTPGDYILVAGSDLDGNGFICENGEACAEYPAIGARQEIPIRDGDALRLDLTTGYRRPSIAEMGLPRYGFEGYPVPGVAPDTPGKQLR